VADKPSFRAAIRKRRCLVPANGFYEWAKGTRQPYHVSRPGRALLGFAGLYERWSPEGSDETIESCTVITTGANPRLAAIHHRMPVVLAREDFATWLDPEIGASEEVLALLRPWPEDDTVLTPVSRHVNDVRNDDPGCLEPCEAPGAPAQLGLAIGPDAGSER
jgi:putative SOS response-associated peptidase YedK